MWRELVDAADGIGVRMAEPAAESAIMAAGRLLGSTLPDALIELLMETDGLRDQYGLGIVWTVREIADHNRDMRETADFRDQYMPFDCMLFFGQIGEGDLVGFRVLRDTAPDDVYLWDHELDSRIWIAPDLEHYLTRQLQGGGSR